VVGVIPAFNEAATLAATLAGLSQIPELTEIWVVDDGSTDGTARIARQWGAKVIRRPHNGGKAAALAHAFRTIAADIYLLLDADLGAQAKLLRTLLPPVLAGEADMTVAVFHRPFSARRHGGFGLVRRLARLGIHWLTGVTVREPLSGQRALTREVVRTLRPAYGYGIEVALTVDALRAGLRTLEVDTPLVQEGTGRTLQGFLHRGRQFLHVALTLLGRLKGP